MGIAKPTVVLGSSGMFMAIKRMMCKVVRELYQEMIGRKDKEDLPRKKTHTYSLGFLLTTITVLIKIRNPRLHD